MFSSHCSLPWTLLLPGPAISRLVVVHVCGQNNLVKLECWKKSWNSNISIIPPVLIRGAKHPVLNRAISENTRPVHHISRLIWWYLCLHDSVTWQFYLYVLVTSPAVNITVEEEHMLCLKHKVDVTILSDSWYIGLLSLRKNQAPVWVHVYLRQASTCRHR